MSKQIASFITTNQRPHKKNYLSRLFRRLASQASFLGVISRPNRPQGISIIMRVKDEMDWIEPSCQSIMVCADEIVIVDNGSTDGTYQTLQLISSFNPELIRLWRQPGLDHCALSNFALEQTRFRWVFRWDGDMVAHTSGKNDISVLRKRILSLDPRRYYLIYLSHVNLSGDLWHQDPREMVHIEEYIHTYSRQARYVHPRRFEAIKVPKYFRVLFWYEPYSFHLNIKPARRMLLRYFWEDWMELKEYDRFPTLEDYVEQRIDREFGTSSWEEAERIYLQKTCLNHIRYDQKVFGPYPELLNPFLERPRYRLKYKNRQIIGRVEN